MKRRVYDNDDKKNFVESFLKMCQTRSKWEVWRDLMCAMSCMISNTVDHDHYEERQAEFQDCAKRLGDKSIPLKMLTDIADALDNDPEQDFLGDIYMDLELNSHWKEQFFTPYSICKMMAKITGFDADEDIEKNGYATICDDACGAGATMIAFANFLKYGSKYNYQRYALFVGQDIDRVAAQMCYIQLSLLGCAGYVCVGDSLANPLSGDILFPNELEGQELWYTPMFYSDIWNDRKMIHLCSLLER